MHDLTQGSIPRHLLRLALPIAIGMLFQTMYYLIDLYFVAQLGDAAIAGVSAAGNAQFIVMALTQVLGVGTMALIAHAWGRRDTADAVAVFHQGLSLAAGFALFTLIAGYGFSGAYMHQLGADAATGDAGTAYLFGFLPGLALQFALVAMGSALRGIGIVKPTMLVQLVSVVLNAVLAPVLIAGWLTGHPLGVFGAGLASSISVAVGLLLMWRYFVKLGGVMQIQPALLRPRWSVCKRILSIGLPPGGEFLLMFLYMAAIYWIIRDFGAAAQAGFGIGSRVMQAIFLPAMAIAFAAAPLAGQNMGARQMGRVRSTFGYAALMGSSIMLVLSLLCQLQPAWLVHGFTDDAQVLEVATGFLSIISWNFVATGLVFTCSGMFQALGNTVPALLSSATRIFSFVFPALWLSHRPGFQLRHLWLLSVTTVLLQVLVSLLLLRREFRRRAVVEVEPAVSA